MFHRQSSLTLPATWCSPKKEQEALEGSQSQQNHQMGSHHHGCCNGWFFPQKTDHPQTQVLTEASLLRQLATRPTTQLPSMKSIYTHIQQTLSLDHNNKHSTHNRFHNITNGNNTQRRHRCYHLLGQKLIRGARGQFICPRSITVMILMKFLKETFL